MILLVVGADRVDAGKTTFSTGLLERTGARGYKPRAGNDYWFDHDDCQRALSAGRLYGKDATRLATAEGHDRAPERLNPVHRLWRPAPGGESGLLGRDDREFLVDRIGRPATAAGDDATDIGRADDGTNRGRTDDATDIGRTGDATDGERTDQHDAYTYVRNATVDLPESVRDRLPLEDALEVHTVEQLNEIVAERYVPAFEAIATEIESTDVAVVESYSDIAQPLQSLDPAAIAAVAAVEPGRVRIYPGDRYCRACEIASSSPRDGALEKRVPDVLTYLDPLERIELPPLGDDDRTDPRAIARAYGDAYDAFLEAARENARV